jgi:hypothetical protein
LRIQRPGARNHLRTANYLPAACHHWHRGGFERFSQSGTLFGVAQEVDIGDRVAVDYAHVFGGSYPSLAGGAGGALNGANSTLQRWAFSIGGTAAHEAGHTYGLQHNDDFLQNSPSSGCSDGTDQTKAGEDPLTR